ncbi:MAG: branched-chain amino acid ABC transporter permease [Anaerolineae bacterium]|nr:branched-chain amino acid ABC transporter permease [Thermoflexales bacterium]MDW8408409.1 branched-chain amino acid ABC transporter permease [Anaerolineae bacterium]
MQQASAEQPIAVLSADALSVAPRQSGAGLAWIGRGFLLALAALVVFILARNLLDNPRLFAQIVISGLQLGFVYALIALGYTMVYGIVRLINFAHGDVFMVGSFVSFFAVSRFSLHTWPAVAFPGISPDLSTLIGAVSVIVLSMIVCAALAVVIERVAYKPLRNAPRITALITAIGVSFFLEFFGALNFVFSPRFIPYQRPFDVYAYWIGAQGIGMVTPQTPAPDGSITFSSIFVIIVVASILMQILLQWLVKRTKIGKAMRASAVDKPTTRLMGVNVDRVISFTFAVGAAFAGLAGVLFAIAYPSIHTQLGILPGLKAFVAAVLGGIGSIPGALVGALIMGQAEALTAGYISTPMRDAVAFTILIIVLLVRPTGIFGEPEREKA